MFSPRKTKASPGGTAGSRPGGIAFDVKSVVKHDVGKERKFRTKVHCKTLACRHDPCLPTRARPLLAGRYSRS